MPCSREKIFAPGEPAVDDDLRVAAAAQPTAGYFELSADLHEAVDPGVEPSSSALAIGWCPAGDR